MTFCPTCDRQNEANYKFCYVCGTPLSPAHPQPEPMEEVSETPIPETIREPEPESISISIPTSAPEPEPEPELQLARICGTCGTLIQDGFLFCGKCGNRYEPDSDPLPEPEPVNPVVAKLVQIQPDGSVGEEIELFRGDNQLGRVSDNPILRNDSFLSPEHVLIKCDPPSVEITDLNSLNGVFVRISEEIELSHNTLFRIGQELIRFEFLDRIKQFVTKTDEKGTLNAGSPLGDYWARLTRISNESCNSQAHISNKHVISLGREEGDLTFPFDGFVSSNHCQITYRNKRAYIKDLGSSNGSYLQIQGSKVLFSNQYILLGQQLFRVQVM